MPESDYALKDPPIRTTISTISEAITYFDSLNTSKDEVQVFRGHADISWKVAPSIFRDDMDIIPYESRIVRDLISRYPNDFDQDKTMFDRLVRMQHFGLRTRLMDVTRNPLAALYFAVEDGPNNDKDGAVLVIRAHKESTKYYDSDAVSCISNLSNLSEEEKISIETTSARSLAELHKLNAVDRLYQFIRSEKPEFRPRIKRSDLLRPYFVFPKLSNKRIIAQNGAFLIFGLKGKREENLTNSLKGLIAKIPKESKPQIRKSLQKLGYDDSTLFPEIERSSRQIMKSYCV